MLIHRSRMTSTVTCGRTSCCSRFLPAMLERSRGWSRVNSSHSRGREPLMESGAVRPYTGTEHRSAHALSHGTRFHPALTRWVWGLRRVRRGLRSQQHLRGGLIPGPRGRKERASRTAAFAAARPRHRRRRRAHHRQHDRCDKKRRAQHAIHRSVRSLGLATIPYLGVRATTTGHTTTQAARSRCNLIDWQHHPVLSNQHQALHLLATKPNALTVVNG